MSLVIGVTGSIGMGKTTIAAQFHHFDIPVFSADDTAKEIIRNDKEVISKIANEFPECTYEDVISRNALGEVVFQDENKLRRLGELVQPAIYAKMQEFLKENVRKRLVVLDIPLLFEAKWDRICDYTVVVTAPKFLQIQRVTKRPSMDLLKLENVLATQMPDKLKRARADFVIKTGIGKAHSMRHVKEILCKIGE